jgi:hypothetical protein
MIVRMDEIAEASFALIRERIRFGMAIAAMITIMATTISSSISENPFCFRPIAIKLRDLWFCLKNRPRKSRTITRYTMLQVRVHSQSDSKRPTINDLRELHEFSLATHCHR